MKVGTLRSFLALHTWIGLTTGLLLFIAFYAGALTVFHDELEAWESPVPRNAVPVDAARAQALIDALLRAHPQAAESFQLNLGAEPGDVPTIYWHGATAGGGEARSHAAELAADGRLREIEHREGLADFVYRLHFTAGVPTPWGTWLFGVVCVLYGLALVSGVVIYLPTLVRDLFALRVGRNVKRFWQDAHNLAAMLSLPFHVLFAWSGAVLTIGTLMLAPFQFLVFDGRLVALVGPEIGLAAPPPAQGLPAASLSVAQTLAAAASAVPGLAPTRLAYVHAGDAGATITVDGVVEQRRVVRRATITLLGASAGPGEVVQRVADPARATPGQSFLYGLFALHFGDYGGAPVRWLTFVLGLVGAFVFYSGNLLWVEARRRHRDATQRVACLRMAQATLGVSLGCVGAIAAMALATRLAPLVGLVPAFDAMFWATLLLATAWALTHAPVRAAQDLLAACTALYGAAVVVDVALAPQAWRAHAGVDAAALALAGLFVWMLNATRRRALDGDPNSVWAGRPVR